MDYKKLNENLQNEWYSYGVTGLSDVELAREIFKEIWFPIASSVNEEETVYSIATVLKNNRTY